MLGVISHITPISLPRQQVMNHSVNMPSLLRGRHWSMPSEYHHPLVLMGRAAANIADAILI